MAEEFVSWGNDTAVPLKREYMDTLFRNRYLTKLDARKWLERNGFVFEEQTPIYIQPKGSAVLVGSRMSKHILEEHHTVHIWTATQSLVEFEDLWEKEAVWVTLQRNRERVISGQALLWLLDSHLAGCLDRQHQLDVVEEVSND